MKSICTTDIEKESGKKIHYVMHCNHLGDMSSFINWLMSGREKYAYEFVDKENAEMCNLRTVDDNGNQKKHYNVLYKAGNDYIPYKAFVVEMSNNIYYVF